jgi:hypothetical protein
MESPPRIRHTLRAAETESKRVSPQTGSRKECPEVNEQRVADLLTDASAGACPRCGASRSSWPDDAYGGFVADSAVYCCAGCRDGTGCTCTHFGRRALEHAKVDAALAESASAADIIDRAPTAEEIRYDPASAEFLNELRKEHTVFEPEDYRDPNVMKGVGPTAAPD